MSVSVIVPTYNESARIRELIESIGSAIPAGLEYEIIVVDDDSPDGTAAVVDEMSVANPAVRCVKRTSERGLALSIRAGVERASGHQIVVMDADFTHDPAEIPRLLHVADLYDVVSGSRFCAGGSMQDRSHYVASFIFNLGIRLILRTQVQDNLGGFFTMRRSRILELPLDDIFFGYGDYFFRLLHYAERRGMTVVEVPAVYSSRRAGQSKSSFMRMLVSYSREVLALRRSLSRAAQRVGG